MSLYWERAFSSFCGGGGVRYGTVTKLANFANISLLSRYEIFMYLECIHGPHKYIIMVKCQLEV